jgi:hypothetical protein
MQFFVQRLQTLTIHMGVNLSGRYVAVAEEFLDDPQIRPALKQVSGERMTEQMRVNVLLDAGTRGALLDDLADAVG